jgi:hypothetical protein
MAMAVESAARPDNRTLRVVDAAFDSPQDHGRITDPLGAALEGRPAAEIAAFSDLSPITPIASETGVRAVLEMFSDATRSHLESQKTLSGYRNNGLRAPEGATATARQAQVRTEELKQLVKMLGQEALIDPIHRAALMAVYKREDTATGRE